jgi:hypothetical protein
MTSHDLEACRKVVVDIMAEHGAQVTVSTEPPLVRGAYETAAFSCPHGVMLYVEPTGEQIAVWARGGAR